MSFDPASFAGRGRPAMATGGAVGGQQQLPRAPSAGAAPGVGGSAAGASGGAKRNTTQPLRPMTIKMLLEATRVGDGAMVVDGREVGQVSVVGRVVEHETGAQSTTTAKSHGYRITDGTGIMTVRHWLDNNSTEEEHMLPVGTYMRACGNVRTWQDKPMLTGSVRFMNDNNEMLYHFLDVILTHLRLTQGPKSAPAARTAPSSEQGIKSAGMGGGSAQPSAAAVAPRGPQGEIDPVSLENAVRRALMQGKRSAAGVNFDDICSAVANHGYTAMDVKSTLRRMMDEGNIYSTDDVHYNF